MATEDDRQLDAFLARTSALADIYRSGPGEVPPPAVDQAVLEHARAAVRGVPPAGAPRAARPRRAPLAPYGSRRAPLALAAVLVLSVTIVLVLERVPPLDEESTRPDSETVPERALPAAESRPPSAGVDSAANLADEPPRATRAPLESRRPSAERDQAGSESGRSVSGALQGSARAKREAEVAGDRDEAPVEGNRAPSIGQRAPATPQSRVETRPLEHAPAPAAAFRESKAAPTRERSTVADAGADALVGEARRLLETGRESDARAVLERLRRRYPDYRIPDDVLARIPALEGSTR